jgi:uncharacterized UPF0160 family protein
MSKIKIVTHSSKFHTDDIFAVATLMLVLGDENIEVIRSRDMDIIKTGDYVVDVGEVYDPTINRFDHHQGGGAGKRENGIPYASFGLVWKHFGSKLCVNENIARKIDESIVQPIDANDNGFQFLESKVPNLYPLDSGFVTYIFSPTWKEDDVNINEAFMQMVSYAKVFLKRAILVKTHTNEAESFVLEAYNNAVDKRIIELDERYPWEKVLSGFPEPVYVIYKKRIDNNWSIKCVPKDFFTYENRKKLPESWGGKSGEELTKVTGVEGSVFCHNARFMAVNKTKEGILKMAEIALNN